MTSSKQLLSLRTVFRLFRGLYWLREQGSQGCLIRRNGALPCEVSIIGGLLALKRPKIHMICMHVGHGNNNLGKRVSVHLWLQVAVGSAAQQSTSCRNITRNRSGAASPPALAVFEGSEMTRDYRCCNLLLLACKSSSPCRTIGEIDTIGNPVQLRRP